jgi:NADH dehydrogenase
MKRVVVIGGGFAGLTAAARLARSRAKPEVVLFDRTTRCDFKPLLPDAVGRCVPLRHMSYPIDRHAARFGYSFRAEEVVGLDTSAREVVTATGAHGYDALILAAGARVISPPPGGEAYPLYSTGDAARMIRATADVARARVVVVGGGYTGIEIATQLLAWSRRIGRPRPVTIVESGDTVLRGLDDSFQRYARANLARMGIATITGVRARAIDGGDLVLSDGRRIHDGLVAWSPGLAPVALVERLDVPKGRAGRIAVGPDLSFAPDAFAAGDAAAFTWRGAQLRPSFQFALSEGAHAAGNALRRLAGRAPLPFRPVDLGWVVPMANGRSCGRALGLNVFGPVPTLLHYFMCVVRSYGLGNRLGIVSAVLRRAL